jgi:ABC-type amino acid transport substrate-binding protein
MKKRILKKLALIMAFSLSAAVFSGCSKTTDTSANAAQDTQAQTAGTAQTTVAAQEETATTQAPKKIVVGIGNAFAPFCYLDENEKLAGYEYEILKLVDEALPQYEFTYEPTAFKNLFVGLDTDAYDVIVQNMGWNSDRAAKYLYGNVSNFNSGSGYVIEAKAGRTDIQTEDDLQGKKVGVSSTFNGSYRLEEYNANHGPDEQIIIVYSDATTDQRWSDIINGVLDATISNEYVHVRNVAAYGDGVDAYGDNVFAGPASERSGRYLYNYGDEQLRDDIDEVLQKLLDDGTLKALSLEFFGVDYASEPEQ